ncbi:hypothetical protein B0H10DRAFT_718015 [Mycena sp. CBHHK59/15]|nr:hypothetical protein B0H10DRAFT_718015 [Mycena sp. CBHHK59/15]
MWLWLHLAPPSRATGEHVDTKTTAIRTTKGRDAPLATMDLGCPFSRPNRLYVLPSKPWILYSTGVPILSAKLTAYVRRPNIYSYWSSLTVIRRASILAIPVVASAVSWRALHPCVRQSQVRFLGRLLLRPGQLSRPSSIYFQHHWKPQTMTRSRRSLRLILFPSSH